MVQGRRITPEDLAGIRELVKTHPEWSRRRLSEALVAAWDWRNPAGRLKDMAARTLLVKLEARGLIELPERRQQPYNRMGGRPHPAVAVGPDPGGRDATRDRAAHFKGSQRRRRARAGSSRRPWPSFTTSATGARWARTSSIR